MSRTRIFDSLDRSVATTGPPSLACVRMTALSADSALDEAGVAAKLARAVLADLDTVSDKLVGEIIRHNPEYYDSQRVAEPDLRESCRRNLERLLQLLGRCVPQECDAYDAARDTGTKRARQRVALDLVLRSFRIGGRVVWSSALETARADSEVDPETLLDVGTSIWTVVDAVSLAVSDSYRATELEMLRADEQRRQVLVDGLLRGSGEDTNFVENALRALGLPLKGPYLAVAADLAHRPEDVSTPEAALAASGIRSVWQVQADTLIGLVAPGERDLDEVADLLERVVPAGLGISPTVERAEAAPHARELALLALRTIPRGRQSLAWLDDRLPQALLAHSPELADRLIDRALGPILRQPEPERDLLLNTLRTWLWADRSAKLTASRMYCHRNTVLNRLGRVETLCGRTVNDVTDSVWLFLALQALALRGR